MKVFIVGATGLVGSHCHSVFSKNGQQVIGTHLTFQSASSVFFDPRIAFKNIKLADGSSYVPDVIIHCGALTNVDHCETNQEESFTSTVTSTKNIADFCVNHNIKLVYVSTDYIFNGISGPYYEDDEQCPINTYGEHKLQAENIAKTVADHLIVRITNVYGEESRNKNFLARLIISFKNHEIKSITLPYDQFSTPIYAGDVAKMIFCLISDSKRGVYNLSSTDYFSRYNFANKAKTFFNNTSVNINAATTPSLNQQAKRPLNGGLLNLKFCLEYPEFMFTTVDNFLQKNIE